MMKEIGSEYWEKDKTPQINNLEFINFGRDIKYLMSGRTAIDYILKNIKDSIKIVYMPDYCCESMVRPFIDNDYKVKYYKADIINNQYSIDVEEEFSIFFAMSYFGYSESNMDQYIEKISTKNITIIEDITHRLFQKNNHCKNSTYVIASLRKWVPIYTGAIAVNLTSKFNESIENYTTDSIFLEERKLAMRLKRDYISGKNNDKKAFLELYSTSNKKINNYKNKKMDDESIRILKEIDINKMIKVRKENVQIIEDKLKNNKNIRLIFKQTESDCPLFVPILIHNRNEITKKLIEKNIYCPTHWPNFANMDNKIYDQELSLICDQRYDSKEINEYIDKVIEIVGE